MSWDLRQDLTTGDWVFDSIRDLQGVEAEYLTQQRIHVRLMIDRGQFIYDRSGTLGSRLRSVIGMGLTQAKGGLEGIVREALDPMTDIAVSKVTIFTFNDGSGVVTNPNTIQAKIEYNMVFALEQDIVSEIPGQVSTQVTIPI